MLGLLALLVAGCDSDSDDSQEPFPSYNPDFKPPASEYSGPIFKLSQDYPAKKPATALPEFFKTDYKKDWRKYMMQVRDYCFAGNTEVDWRVEKNKVRRWYHMPWQHYGPAGREAIHGLTREAPLQPFQLAASEPYPNAVAYAIGFYNDLGAYAIGQVWKDHEKPNPEPASTDGFPNGAVVCKTLFVDMPPADVAKQVPYLKNPLQWKAYTAGVDEPIFSSPERSVKDVALIQMDIMIRDERAPSGWILGTFQYNGELAKKDRWQNLAPVGLMWGNDPDLAENDKNVPVLDSQGAFPAEHAVTATPINADLEETVINPDEDELPPTHLGWEGRLNGPVDNPLSSCMSCHMTASSPNKELSPLFTTPAERVLNGKPVQSGTPEWNEWWMQWFQNVGWKDGVLEKFMDATYALDFSLQMSQSLQNFAKSEQDKQPGNPVHR